jgi:hypothetical protein
MLRFKRYRTICMAPLIVMDFNGSIEASNRLAKGRVSGGTFF